jgi:hypothetical protein
MIRRLILGLAALAAASGLLHAADGHETLTVLRECPSKGWHRACLALPFVFADDNSGRLHTRSVDAGGYQSETWLDYILVKGSLLESKGPGSFRLSVSDRQVSISEIESPNELGVFAFVGRSAKGRPIALTDRGPLEIHTASVTFSGAGDLFVVNEKTGKLLRQLVHGVGTAYVVTTAGEIGSWDAQRAICISAPTNRTRDLAIITTACKKAGLPTEERVVGGAVVSATDYDEALVRSVAFDPTDMEVYRVPGTDLLLIWAKWEYCC